MLQFLYIYLIFLLQRLYWIVLWVAFENNCIIIYVRLDLTFVCFSSYLCFYIPVYNVLNEILVKSNGR